MKNNVTPNEEFYSLEFFVDQRVLTPRNETEILVDKALKIVNNTQIDTLIDIGTGSGCIPISIIKNTLKIPSFIYAVDISDHALEVSKINIIHHNLENIISLFLSDLLQVFFDKNLLLESRNILITANLPYIKDGDFDNMDYEVLENDPHIALFWWQNTGFEIYEKLIKQILSLKEEFQIQKIYLLIEIGFDQYEYVKNYLSLLDVSHIFYKDYLWIERCVCVLFE